MLSELQVEEIKNKILQLKDIQYIDHGFDGVVFQYQDKILKVFPEFEKANAEIIGFQEVSKFCPILVPKIYQYGKIDNYYGLIREDIWDANAFSEEINSRNFIKLIEETSILIKDKVLNGMDIDILVTQECDKFRENNDIDDDNELFTNDLLLLAVHMQLNNTPLNDISLDNIGISAEEGYVKIRDMSRFKTDRTIDLNRNLLLKDNKRNLCM